LTCNGANQPKSREAKQMQRAEIRIEGCLDLQWAEWFEGFTLKHTSNRETILAGEVADQAAFYGLIGKLRDLGVRLLAINLDKEECEIPFRE
jgi:hypothetical protein